MRSSLTLRGWAWSVGLVTAPFLALLLGDPAPVLAVLPLTPLVVFGLLTQGREAVSATSRLVRPESVEGEISVMEIEVESGPGWGRIGLRVPPGSVVEVDPGVAVVGGGVIEMPVRGRTGVTVRFRVSRWGGYQVGVDWVEVSGRVPIRSRAGTVSPPERLVVLPATDEVRRLVEPLETNMHAGDLMSRERGPGTELMQTRPWSPGDPPRSINWRATLRSDDVWVTDRHAERNGDLVLVVDPIGDPEGDASGALREVILLTGALVRAYGRTRHRLGLVDLAGGMRWFGLASGPAHTHRLLTALIASQIVAQPVWSAVDRVLARSVRPPSMVVFVTTLVDDAVVGRIRDLAVAGIDTAVVAIDPEPWMRVGSEPRARLARRIWKLERERVVSRLAESRVVIGEWAPGRSLDEVMEGMQTWRRRLQRLRA